MMRPVLTGLLALLAIGVPTVTSMAAQESVVFKILAVNPSATDTKEVTVRAVLPPEVKAENVLDADGLAVEYDSQFGAFLVTGVVSLKPKGSMVKNIIIEDVWVIPSASFDRLFAEVDEILGKLQETTFFDRGRLMGDAIERRLRELQEHHDTSFLNPEAHISRYREDLKQLQMVESELVSLRQLMVMAALNPANASVVIGDDAGAGAGGADHGSLSVLTTWRIVFMILGLLGVVSLSFFFVWQRQLKTQLARQAAAPGVAQADQLFSGGSGASLGAPAPPPKTPLTP